MMILGRHMYQIGPAEKQDFKDLMNKKVIPTVKKREMAQKQLVAAARSKVIR